MMKCSIPGEKNPRKMNKFIYRLISPGGMYIACYTALYMYQHQSFEYGVICITVNVTKLICNNKAKHLIMLNIKFYMIATYFTLRCNLMVFTVIFSFNEEPFCSPQGADLCL